MNSMPNPHPTQSEEFITKRFQRQQVDNSCVPADTVLADHAISVRLPAGVDRAVRALGKQKAAWLREAICQVALETGLIDEVQ